MNKSYFLLLASFCLSSSLLCAQDHDHDHDIHLHEEGFDHATFNPTTGEGFVLGGFIFPDLFVTATGGAFEPGANASDFATSEHDPQNELGFQAIEPEVHIETEHFSGLFAGFIFQGEDHEWEGELEEAYLHYKVTENIAIGGGQFLTHFGWQNQRHVHQWDFVNQNLVTSRMLNEGEFVIQGAEAVIDFPNFLNSRLTIGGGGVRAHGHEEEEEEEDGEEEEEHHFELDNASFNDWALALDYRFHLPNDNTTTFAASYVTGENGFGQNTHVLGAGVEKIWNPHCDHDDASHDHDHNHGDDASFGPGSILWRTQYMYREFDFADEDGDEGQIDDRGVSTELLYGLSDRATASFRHGWVSEIEEAELSDRHRFSPALTFLLGRHERLRTRFQYDYTQGGDVSSEHAAWLQINWHWGPSARDHNH